MPTVFENPSSSQDIEELQYSLARKNYLGKEKGGVLIVYTFVKSKFRFYLRRPLTASNNGEHKSEQLQPYHRHHRKQQQYGSLWDRQWQASFRRL